MSASIHHVSSLAAAHHSRAIAEAPSSPPLTASTEPSYFNGHAIKHIASHSQHDLGKATQGIAREKFKITMTSSWWSGTNITIVPLKTEENHQGSVINEKATQTVAAEALLQKLGTLSKTGIFILKKKGHNEEIQLQYKKFWFTPRQEQKEAAGAYISSLLGKAYPDIPLYYKEKLDTKFQNYLTAVSNNISAEDLAKKVNLFKQKAARAAEIRTDYHQEITATKTKVNTNAEALFSTEKIQKLPPSTTPIDFLTSQGVGINPKCIGKGGFGMAYQAKINGKEYIYKQEQKGRLLNNPKDPELNGKFWRDGDIASARLKDLPHFAKAAGFILEINSPGKTPEQWYIPADKTKDFGVTVLPPGTEVTLLAQLMEKAPGKELFEHLNSPNFNGVEHFDPIADQLFSFLEKSYARNLIHRDLKAQNFMYDANPQSPTYKQGTVIDFGLGGVYRKREKQQSAPTSDDKGKNPFESIRLAGTAHYLAPAVVEAGTKTEARLYGAEVDFHSAAAMLVELLDPKSFEQVTKAFINSTTNLPFNASLIPTHTQGYIDKLPSNSILKGTLKDHPAMRATINLFFDVASAKPGRREEALQKLRTHMATRDKPVIASQKTTSEVTLNPRDYYH